MNVHKIDFDMLRNMTCEECERATDMIIEGRDTHVRMCPYCAVKSPDHNFDEVELKEYETL